MGLLNLSLGNLVVHLTANTTRYERALKRAETSMLRTSKKMTAIGKKMTLAVTLPLAAIGVMAVRSFAKFDDAMTKSLAIMGNVTDGMRKKMERTARTISTKGVTSAEELAKSYFFLASAGMNAEQSVAALATVEQFAVAGAFNMSLATDLLTDAQTALGLSTKDTTRNMQNMTRVSDVLVRANTLANASVEQFSRALTTKAAASLRNLNKEMEEGVAVLAAFADQGIKGELAGEKLSIVVRDLQVAAIKQTGAWRQLGVSTFDVNDNMRNMADIIEDLEGLFGGMNDRQKKSTALMMGFQMRSFSAIESLLGMSGAIRVYEKALKDAGGTTDDVAKKQLKSFSAQMKKMWNNIVDASIGIGAELEPTITELSKTIQGAVDWWRSLNSSTRKHIVSIGLYLAVAGPMLFLVGKLIGMFSAFITVVRISTKALAFHRVMLLKNATAMKTLAVAAVALGAFKFGSWLNDEFIIVRNAMTTAITFWRKAWLLYTRTPKLAAIAILSIVHELVSTIIKLTTVFMKTLAKPAQWLEKLTDKIGLTSGALQKWTADVEKSLTKQADAHKKAAISIMGTFDDPLIAIKEQLAALDASDREKRKLDEAEIARIRKLNKIKDNAAKKMKSEVAGMDKFGEQQAKIIENHKNRMIQLLKEEDAVQKLKEATIVYNAQVEEAERIADSVGNAFERAFEDAIMGARSFEEVLKGLSQELTRIALRALILKPLGAAISGEVLKKIIPSAPALGGGTVDLSNVVTSLDALGNAYSGGRVTKFADGGVVNSPSLFPLAGGRKGLMGEAGPEAIMPLERGADGKLGIKSSGKGAIAITMNVYGVQDADSFNRSRPQIISDLRRGLRS